ncbi:hypothetical protein ACA910_004672 [Epithemia clementina (nom. ined.)]
MGPSCSSCNNSVSSSNASLSTRNNSHKTPTTATLDANVKTRNNKLSSSSTLLSSSSLASLKFAKKTTKTLLGKISRRRHLGGLDLATPHQQTLTSSKKSSRRRRRRLGGRLHYRETQFVANPYHKPDDEAEEDGTDRAMEDDDVRDFQCMTRKWE